MSLIAAMPVREFMPELPHLLQVLLYVALVPTAVAFLWLLNRRIARSGTNWRELARGVVAAVKANPRLVLRRLFFDVLAQERVRRDRLGAALHLLIYGSFIALLIGTTLVGVEEDITKRFGVTFLHGATYLAFEFLLDTAALGLIAGTALGIWRRYGQRPAHLGRPDTVNLVYGLLLYFSVSGLVLEALRILVRPQPWTEWSYAGHGLSLLLEPLVGADPLAAYRALWIAHVVVVFVFIGALPFLMLNHILVLPMNIALQASREPGVLRTPFNLPEIIAAEGDLEGVQSGFSNPRDLPWDRRFMLDACINCGRCEAVCPANAAGRPLSPRVLVQALGADLRSNVLIEDPIDGDVFARDVLEEATAWSCVQCGACARECPALIDQPGTIVDLRRHLVEEGRIDERQAAVLAGLERNQNPLGLPSYQRADWLAPLGVPLYAEKPDAEYLYWMGCMASYDQRVRKVAVAMVRILQHAGVSFAVLGDEERCLGEAQRKLGDEAGFQMRAMENIELFNGYNVRKILTHCPHCLATLTKDYPEFGGKYEVIHHSQFLAQLIEEGRVPAPEGGDTGTLTFHDPCNLGRLGGEYEAPRQVAKFASGGKVFVEIGKSRDRSFCCGAGGANYFYKVPEQESVAGLRLAQAVETGADTVAVGCPFCLGMLEGAAGTAGDGSPAIVDIAELVAAGLPGTD